jgi:uncharacterized membrane protein
MTDAQYVPPLTLDTLRASHKKPRNIHKEVTKNTGKLGKLACLITDKVGTMGFFLTIFIWTVLWLGWNLLAPKEFQFDPPMGFVLWLFISNLIQLMLMPLIMLGQNIQGQHAEQRAEYDLEINVKAEKEVETILFHLEHQNRMLQALMEKQGVMLSEALKKPHM